ncbi:MAG TPA: polysaccharide deacetylase family protein [Tepidisphaeraceae bacterium]|nr:polysaccharide deacetylase family protein [Tepidisphaeraceae bacterium]
MVRIPGLGRVRAAIRRARNRRRCAAVVLLYHRVTELASDPQWLTVPPKVFDAQMAMLAREYEVISVPALVAGLKNGRLPKRAVAITFDDGYADNLTEAAPILERHKVPAAFYVASGFVGGTEEVFSDELERLLLTPGGKAGTLKWGRMGWDLPAMKKRGPWKRWNVLADPPTARHAAYRDLCTICADMPHAGRVRVLETVRAFAGEPAEGRATHRFVTEEQLRALAASPVATIGAHTVTHPRLSAIPVEEQGREIRESKRRIEEVIGKPVTTFAYPFGGPADQTDETVRCVREAGFEAASVNHGGCVRRGADPFRLNRVLARDWSAQELKGRIEEEFLV